MSRSSFIWLCSTSEDRGEAEHLRHRLQGDGFDLENIVFPERHWDWRLIEDNVFHRPSDVVVILIACGSRWSRSYRYYEELEYFLRKEWRWRDEGLITIFVRLDPHAKPYPIFPEFPRQWHIVDLFDENDYLQLRQVLRQYVDYARPKPMAAPPPVAAPPFRLIGIYALIATIIFVIGLIISLIFFPSTGNPTTVSPPNPPSPIWGQIGIVVKGLVVASILSLVPTIAAKLVGIENRVKLSLAELLVFLIVLFGIAYDLFRFKGNGAWMFFAFLVVAFLDIGAHLVDWLRESTFRRVDKTWQYKSLRKDAASFDELYKYERILYAALPLGIMIGTFMGIFQKATEIEVAILSIRAITLSALLILILITYKSFKQMIVPMYPFSNPPDRRPVFTSRQRNDVKGKEEKTFSLAIMSTDLRKLYLYDSTHNILLMFLFMYSLLLTYNVRIELKFLVLTVLLATLIFSQFPYVLGQYLLHQKVLEVFEGFPRAEVDEKLKRYVPLFPTFHFIAALLSTGTAGGLVFFLLDNFVKGLFK